MSGFELLMCLCLVLVVASVYIGCLKVKDISVFIEVNTFTSPYYVLGVSYEYREVDDKLRIDQLTIGMVFINLNICFLKDIDA